ncbi:putative entry exclusion protein TrbK-alt [Sphingomonas sp. PL20]|uniref:putative entry exclusion protein TrbK-alt n=1 Tax=Sphingomonas sp. PL20 TaxID=2760712 RepID=UPI0030594175
MRRPKPKRASALRGFAAIEMGPVGKIAVGAGLGGLMLAVAIASAMRAPPRPAALPETRPSIAGSVDATPPRCRTVTQSESECASAWEARRRHFFGEEAVQ